TSNNMDATATADGSAATGGDDGDGDGGTAVGVAVAINVATMTNRAVVGNNVTATGDGFSATAAMKNVGGDTTNRFGAKATSGASGGDTGVAGSFALNVSRATSEGLIPSS